MLIRKVEPTDAEALVPLVTQLGYPRTAHELAGRLNELASCMFIAIENHQAIGFIEVQELQTLLEKDCANIMALVVHDNHRRKGVGEKLIEAGAEWAKQRGLDHLRVGTQIKRHDAHAFYEKHGFTLQKQHRIYIKSLS